MIESRENNKKEKNIKMTDFQSMNLPDSLQSNLANMQFTTPTPIQEQAIPVALNGEDILGSAQTGTGKTGAFGIPLIAHLLNNEESCALVMAPTRELATQVLAQLTAMLGKKSPIKSALLIGGDPMPKQFAQLRAKPRLIVGTPGRINDHLKRKTVKLKRTDFLVLDETDRMLDMGFSVQLETILPELADERQTLLFSATMPKNIQNLAKKYLHNPVHIVADAPSSVSENVEQENISCRGVEKYTRLVEELEKRNGSVIVFVKTKFNTEKMAQSLEKDGLSAQAIHGDLRQTRRDRVIKGFRNQKYRILVATDIAARGLDIPHIEHVINYDLPQCAEDYIHRIGRTGRAGASGQALNILTPADKRKWREIEKLLDPSKTFEDDEGEKRAPSSRRRRFRGGKPPHKRRNSNGANRNKAGEQRPRRNRKPRAKKEG